MNIGVCGASQSETGITKGLICHYFLDETHIRIKEYLPAEVLLDLEEMVFNCDILVIHAGAQNKRLMVWLGQQLNKEWPNCQLIYIIAGIEATTEFYEVRHCYLLRKEQMEKFIGQALDKAMESMQIDPGVLELTSKGHRIYVMQKEIIYIERQKRKVRVVTREKIYTTYESIRRIADRIKKPLIRCHAGYIVNLATVENISAAEIRGFEGYQIPLGRTYAAEVRREFKQCWK